MNPISNAKPNTCFQEELTKKFNSMELVKAACNACTDKREHALIFTASYLEKFEKTITVKELHTKRVQLIKDAGNKISNTLAASDLLLSKMMIAAVPEIESLQLPDARKMSALIDREIEFEKVDSVVMISFAGDHYDLELILKKLKIMGVDVINYGIPNKVFIAFESYSLKIIEESIQNMEQKDCKPNQEKTEVNNKLLDFETVIHDTQKLKVGLFYSCAPYELSSAPWILERFQLGTTTTVAELDALRKSLRGPLDYHEQDKMYPDYREVELILKKDRILLNMIYIAAPELKTIALPDFKILSKMLQKEITIKEGYSFSIEINFKGNESDLNAIAAKIKRLGIYVTHTDIGYDKKTASIHFDKYHLPRLIAWMESQLTK